MVVGSEFVMDLGDYERGEEKMDAGSNYNPCVVSVGCVPPFLAKSGLKSRDMWLSFVTKQ